MPEIISEFITTYMSVLLSLVMGFFAIFPANSDRLEQDITEQTERIAQLEKDYSDGKITQLNEDDFYYGDLNKDLADGIKFNELRFIGTHNSYQTASTDEYKNLYGNLSDATFGIVNAQKAEFASETLTDQLNCGIRSLEMDIETFDRNGNISFTCMHAPKIDMTTSCYDFGLAMKEIKMWSDNNPNHLPITIIIEPKSGFLPLEDMEPFNLEYALALDETLKEALGNKLFTPSDMLRQHENFKAMREADDWCKASDMLGKVLILLHDCDVTEDYISVDNSIKTQAMFPMLRADDANRDCTSFILANDPDELLKIKIEIIFEKKIIARTRADKYTDVSESQFQNALNSQAQIVSTDYPPRTDSQSNSYIVCFGICKTMSSIR